MGNRSMRCLEEHVVIELLHGQLPLDEVGRAESHLADCEEFDE